MQSNVTRIDNGSGTDKLPTLNERIQKAIASLDRSIEALGGMLCRAGVVEGAQAIQGGASSAPVPHVPLEVAVDQLEQRTGQVSNLVDWAQRIA